MVAILPTLFTIFVGVSGDKTLLCVVVFSLLLFCTLKNPTFTPADSEMR